MLDATRKSGGIYLYSNLRGCDGNRVYFDGNSMIMQNSKICQMSDMFSVQEVDSMVADVNIAAVRQYRISSKAFGLQTTN
jgi:NAD+ synthase (glutamine-hydrolysing)